MDERGRMWLGVALAAGLTSSTWMLKNAWLRLRGEEVVRVTGSARRQVKADAVVWTAQLTVRADALEDGYQRLETAVHKISDWLRAREVHELLVSAVTVEQLYALDARGVPDRTRLVGYSMAQSVSVRSPEIPRVERLRLESKELMAAAGLSAAGVDFTAGPPRYVFNTLESLKLEVMAQAAGNGRERAARMAAGAGGRLGRLRQAHFIDIATLSEGDNNRYSDDTSSPAKDIVADVELIFDVE
jgi:uncharacterized protein